MRRNRVVASWIVVLGAAAVAWSGPAAAEGEEGRKEPAPEAKAAEVSSPSGTVTLRFRYVKGAVVRQRQKINLTIRFPKVGEGSMLVRTVVIEETEVIEVRPDGTAVLATTTKSMRVDMESAMIGKHSFDSADPDSVKKAQQNPFLSAMVGMCQGLIGVSLRVTVDPRGNAIESSDFDNLGKSMGIAFGDVGNQIVGGPMKFPVEPVCQGSSWPFRSEVNLQGPLVKIVGTAAVAEWDATRRTATIRYEGRQAPPEAEATTGGKTAAGTPEARPAEGASDGKPPPGTPEGTSAAGTPEARAAEGAPGGEAAEEKPSAPGVRSFETKGEAVFDMARGWVVAARSTGTCIQDNPAFPGGEMSMDMEQETVLVE